MSFQYRKVLVLGATSGIGNALAAKFVQTGTSVIVVGRRQDRLDGFVKEYSGSGNATVDSAAFDITNLSAIPQFAASIFEKHPDLDCVFMNSGMQRALNWAEPEKIDLEAIETEVLTNYTSYMHLTKAFLPLLLRQAPKETALAFTTSALGYIPSPETPNYAATKAALHHMILVMREQLRESNVKVIELIPPGVQTELHNFEHGEKAGQNIGMPLADFTEEAFKGLCMEGKGNEQVPVQMAKNMLGLRDWEQARQETLQKFIEMLKKRG